MSDLVIVGGGIMGLSIALEAVRHGAAVTVIERGIPGAEASSAAGGMLAPQLEASGPGPMLELSLRSRTMYRAWAKDLEASSGVDVSFIESGVLKLAFTEDELPQLTSTAAWQRSAGLRVETLSSAEVRQREPAVSSAVQGALLFPDDHQIDPKRLLQALSVAAGRAKITFTSGYVRGLLEEGGACVGVDVDGQAVRARTTIVAAGSWSSLVTGANVSPDVVKPARGQMLELQCRVPPFSRILKTASGYLVPRADGRVVVGSTMEMVGFDKSVTVEGMSKLLAAATQAVPALASAAVGPMWSGLRPWTPDALPILGSPKPGLVLATGHFRNGILLAPVTAQLVGQLLRNEKPAIDLQPFSPARFSC